MTQDSMISPYSLVCMKCRDVFGSDRKPSSGGCGHTFCSKCVQVMKFCDRCGRKNGFLNNCVNYELLKIVEEVKGNVFHYFDYWHGQFGKGIDLDSGICVTCSNFSSKLRICKDCCLEEGTVCESRFQKEVHLVLNHGLAIHPVSKCFERFCVECVLEDRTPHTTHKTIMTSKISKYSIGKHQIAINYVAYKFLKKTILEIVGENVRPINSFLENLHYTLWEVRRRWHCENNSRFYDTNNSEEKKLVVELRRIRERNERCDEIEKLRKILVEEGVAVTKIPAGIEKGDPEKLAELEMKLQELRESREGKNIV